jgi:DNA-binding response OmpR family regulator
MKGHKILVIEDEPAIAEAVAYTLRQEGFVVETASDGLVGLATAASFAPELVILDLMLPQMDGFDVFRALRKRSDAPIIMLTAKVGESDRVAGIELGADDYITKPFFMRELIARVKMILRRLARANAPEGEIIIAGDIQIDLGRRETMVAGKPVSLTPKEFGLLACLARNRGRALTRSIILEQVWGESEYLDEHTVDVHIRWLRQKTEADPARPKRILTVRGVGYKLGD